MSKNTTANIQIIELQKPTGETFSFEMVEVQGGMYKRGSTKNKDEQPVREVSVPTFWIGKFPVIQSLYEFVMDKNPSWFKGKNRPVERVTWEDCKIFIEALNKLSGKNFRLPSEAEWEYAARGGIHWEDNYEYAGGNENELKKVAWYGENSHRETKPVGLKQPNQLGLYDMSGNVWEYCEDHWHGNYDDAPDDGSAWVEKSDDDERVVRGGSWPDLSDLCRVAFRLSYYLFGDDSIIGLRLALPQF
ncbi:MAG: formylglycine-generating enzyme family protein [Chitinophagales bacterium]